MKLCIVDSRRRKTDLDIDETETLLDLKKRLEEYHPSIPPQCQHVCVRRGKKNLETLTTGDDNKSLYDLNLSDGSVIEFEPFRIHVHHTNWNEGQSVTIDQRIHQDTTTEEIKKLVLAKTSIPIHEQRILFYDRYLDDPHDTIGANGVEHDDTLDITDGITLSVLHKPTGKFLFRQACEPNETIRDMKHHIQQTVHVLIDEQEVFWKGKELSDNEATLRETGILHEDTLEFNNEIEGMEFKIRLPTSEVFSIFNINPVQVTVDELKLRIQEIEGIPRNVQYLDFMGTNLEHPEHTLMECKIQKPGDMIDLTPHRVKLTPVEEMVLIIRQQKDPDRGDGDDSIYETLCHLTVLPKDTIRDVKKRIQDKTKILMFLQKLSYKGNVLSDDRPTLHYLEIKSNEVFDLVKLPQEVKVRVIYPSEQNKPDDMVVISNLDRMDTLGYLQEKLEEAQGTAVDKQDLWYRGKRLTKSYEGANDGKEEETLYDLRIKHHAILDLKIQPKPKPKPKPKPAPVPVPAPTIIAAPEPEVIEHNGLRYKMHKNEWDWCKITKANKKRDYIGLKFMRDESDGKYYIDEIDPDGLARSAAPYLKVKARLMMFHEKKAGTYTVEEMHFMLEDEMEIIFETINPTEIHRYSLYNYGGNFEVGEVVMVDGGPAQAEIRRKAKKGNWMVKNMDTGKVVLMDGARLSVNPEKLLGSSFLKGLDLSDDEGDDDNKMKDYSMPLSTIHSQDNDMPLSTIHSGDTNSQERSVLSDDMFSDSESSRGDPDSNEDEVHIESLPEQITTLNITEEAVSTEANAKEEAAPTGRRISLNDEPKNGKKKEREKRRTVRRTKSSQAPSEKKREVRRTKSSGSCETFFDISDDDEDPKDSNGASKPKSDKKKKKKKEKKREVRRTKSSGSCESFFEISDDEEDPKDSNGAPKPKGDKKKREKKRTGRRTKSAPSSIDTLGDSDDDDCFEDHKNSFVALEPESDKKKKKKKEKKKTDN